MIAIRERIRRGEEINLHDFVGATPLHYAAMYARNLVVAELLKGHASKDAQDNKVRLENMNILEKYQRSVLAEYSLINGISHSLFEPVSYRTSVN